MVGKPLLIASSVLCSLGDAMFGYSQGCIGTALVQPSFLRRMYGVQDITLDEVAKGDTKVNEYLIGACAPPPICLYLMTYTSLIPMLTQGLRSPV